MQMRSVLFVGRRNAARSIMAETCFNFASPFGWRAFSAGWQTQRRIDPLTLRVLAARGFPIDALFSKPADIFRQCGAPQIDITVFMDEESPPDAHLYPGHCEHWRIVNPHAATPDQAAYAAAMRVIEIEVRRLITSCRLQGQRYSIAS